MALTSSQLDDVLSVTTQEIRREIPDLFTKTGGFLTELMKVKEKRPGSAYIQQPLFFSEPDTIQWISGTTEPVNVNVQQQDTFATFNWKYLVYTVNFTFDEINRTDGSPYSIGSMAEIKKKQTEQTLFRRLSEWAHGSSATFANKAWNGTADIFAASGTSYGGLSNTDVPNWIPQYDSTTQTIGLTGIQNMLATLQSRVQQPGGSYNISPTWTLVSKALVRSTFALQQQPHQTFVNTGDVNVGLNKIKVLDQDWIIDEYSPGSGTSTADNWLYFFNMPTFNLVYTYGFGNDSPFDQMIQMPVQSVKSNQVYMSSNIICSNRRANGVMKTLSIPSFA